MKREKDGYRLDSGRFIYANCGILGIHHDCDGPHKDVLTEGYDSHVWESRWEDCGNDLPLFTPAERYEIALYMVARWEDWGDLDP